MHILLASLLLILVACRPAAPLATATPPSPTLTGEVTILTPLEGASIYSEVIHLSGTAADIPGSAFELTLTGPDALPIVTHRIQLENDPWQVELPHGYIGAPIEVTVAARPLDPSQSGAYDLVTIVIAGLEYRPAGVFGAITFPPEGSTTGGDQIPVAGTASGISDNRLTLTLLTADDDMIDMQTVILDNPYIINDAPWSAAINTNGYRGEAVLQLGDQQQPLDKIALTIETSAG